MKMKKTALNVLSTAALLGTAASPVVAAIAPVVAHAAGSGTLTANTVPTIGNTGTGLSVGTIKVLIPKATLSGNDNTVTFSLPHGIKLPTATVAGATYYEFDQVTNGATQAYNPGTNFVTGKNYVTVANDGNGNFNNPAAQNLLKSVTALGDSQVQITLAPGVSNPQDDAIILINLNNVNVNGATNGPQNVTFAAPSDSSLPVGSVTVANTQSNGIVDLAATDTTSGSNKFTFNLNLTEEIANSLKSDSNALKIKLPSGYVWDTGSFPAATSSELYGDQNALNNFKLTSNGDTLYLSYSNNGQGTSTATSVKIPLAFEVNDDNQVKNGPINVFVSGTSTTNVSTLQVGQYGDYSASVSAASTPAVVAGQANQQIGDLTIKESVPGTFVAGRTVELTLPDSARWEDVFEQIVKTSGQNDPATAPTPALNITTTNGLNVTPSFTGTDYKTLKLTFNGNGSLGQTDPGEIDLKNVMIATSARATGDINLTVGGSSGVTGTVKVATGSAPGTISVSSVANVQPGQAGQAIGDITVTEAKPGAFNRDSVSGVANTDQIKLKLDAAGVQWDKAPTVTVTSGDASINNVYTSGQYLYFTLNSASGAQAATFKISGGTIKLDNTTPVGPIPVKLQGTAVDYAANNVSAWANDTTTASAATVANVTTGLFGNSGQTAKFVVGQTTFTVNGQSKTLDVAPYIDSQNGRTYVPIRFVAEALGVSDDNIIWDQNSQSVTLIKNGKVATFTVGKSSYTLNGASVPMDGPAEFKDGRNFISIRYAAQALGASVQWDDATQTVTIQ